MKSIPPTNNRLQSARPCALIIAIGVSALFAVSHSSAATVLIDWSRGQLVSGSPSSVVANPAADGKHWNSLGTATVGNVVSPLATTALIDSSGAASGISVAVSFGATSSSTGSGFGGTGIAGPTGADPFDEPNAVNDGIYVNRNAVNADGTGADTSASITFTGLTALTQYDISAIGGRATNGVDGRINIVTGTSGFSTYNLLNNGTISSFSVTSDASGVIVLNFKENEAVSTALNAVFKAMSLTAVPEPTAAMLGALGSLMLLRRRRF